MGAIVIPFNKTKPTQQSESRDQLSLAIFDRFFPDFDMRKFVIQSCAQTVAFRQSVCGRAILQFVTNFKDVGMLTVILDNRLPIDELTELVEETTGDNFAGEELYHGFILRFNEMFCDFEMHDIDFSAVESVMNLLDMEHTHRMKNNRGYSEYVQQLHKLSLTSKKD